MKFYKLNHKFCGLTIPGIARCSCQGAYMTHNSLSGPISRKFQGKYDSFTLNFLYVRNNYSPDPEFCIFLGLGINFICSGYKSIFKMLCFIVKPQIFSPGRYIFLYMPKSFLTATTVPLFFAVGITIQDIACGSCQGWRTV